MEKNGKVITHYKSKEGWFPCGIHFQGQDEYILEFGEKQAGPRIVKRNNESIEVYFEIENYHKDFTHFIQPREVDKKWILWLILISITLFGFAAITMKKNPVLRGAGSIRFNGF